MNEMRRDPLRTVIRHAVFPVTLVVGLLVGHAMLERGTAPEAVIVIYFGLMPFIVWLERVLPRHPEWNRSSGDLRTDMVYFPTTLLIAGGLGALWGGVHLAMAIGLQQAVGGTLWPVDWPLAVQVLLACIVAEFFAYWPHRWMHESPLLWRFHSVHHSPKRVYWLNAARAHPGEHVFRGFISSIPLAVAGAPPEVLAYWLILTRIGGLYQHANIDFALGPFAWIFSIGELHRWHHAELREEANHNYGDTFIFWDTVFGSRYLPAKSQGPSEVGIGGLEAYPTTWWGQMLAPFRFGAIERASEALPPASATTSP